MLSRRFSVPADDFTWKRWGHWYDLMQAGEILGDAIPQIQWCSHGHPLARKMVENALDCITRHGSRKGWSRGEPVPRLALAMQNSLALMNPENV